MHMMERAQKCTESNRRSEGGLREDNKKGDVPQRQRREGAKKETKKVQTKEEAKYFSKLLWSAHIHSLRIHPEKPCLARM
jgi:hypothetical protein